MLLILISDKASHGSAHAIRNGLFSTGFVILETNMCYRNSCNWQLLWPFFLRFCQKLQKKNTITETWTLPLFLPPAVNMCGNICERSREATVAATRGGLPESIGAISLGVAVNMSDHLSHAGLIGGLLLFVCYSVERTKQVSQTRLTCP